MGAFLLFEKLQSVFFEKSFKHCEAFSSESSDAHYFLFRIHQNLTQVAEIVLRLVQIPGNVLRKSAVQDVDFQNWIGAFACQLQLHLFLQFFL